MQFSYHDIFLFDMRIWSISQKFQIICSNSIAYYHGKEPLNKYGFAVAKDERKKDSFSVREKTTNIFPFILQQQPSFTG